MISKALAYSTVLLDQSRGIERLKLSRNGMFAELVLTVSDKLYTTPVVRLIKRLNGELDAAFAREIYPGQSGSFANEYGLCLVSRYGGPFGYVNRIVVVTPVCPCYKEKK